MKLRLLSCLIIYLFFSNALLSQPNDSIKIKPPVKGTVNVQLTNNGLSLFPNLSLGKPAAIINVTVGKNRFFFEPELRWSLQGKPWSYIYWIRYRPKKINEHFGFHVGAHPSYVFREETININAKNEKRFTAQRYAAAEIVPVWFVSPKFSIALHYLHAVGLDSYAAAFSDFLSLQPRFPRIDLSKEYYLSFFPQLFYLQIAENKGTYYSQTLSVNKQDLPFSLTSTITNKFKSTIPGDDFVWSLGLNIKFQ